MILHRGKTYAATLSLTWIEGLATNEHIKSSLESFGFRAVEIFTDDIMPIYWPPDMVRHGSGIRYIVGVWQHPMRYVDLPTQFKSCREIPERHDARTTLKECR